MENALNRPVVSSIGRLAAAVALSGLYGIPNVAAAWCSPSSVGAGALHLWPGSRSGPLTIDSIGGQPVSLPLPASGVRATEVSTAGFLVDCSHDEHWKLRFFFAVPPQDRLAGSGSLQSQGRIGTARQWTPALLLIHDFGPQGQFVRPFMGAGVDYTFFRRVRVTNDAFRASYFGPDSVITASASPSWNPAIVAGLSFQVDARWRVEASAIHAPVRTRLALRADNTAAGAPITAYATLKNRSTVGLVTLNYQFDH